MNVVSTRSIEIFTATIAELAVRGAVKLWLGRIVPRQIRKTPKLLRRIATEYELRTELEANTYSKGHVDDGIRAKLRAAYAAGAELWMFDLHGRHGAFRGELRGVIDWLDAVPETDRHLKRIERMSYADALALSGSWHTRLLRISEAADDPDVVEETSTVKRFDDGSRIVEIKGPVALLREGNLMGHCVGGRNYLEAIENGRSRIFSLRDAANRPHVTIELNAGQPGSRAPHVSQIKGRGNAPLVEKWALPVRAFVKENNWIVGYDGERIGLVNIDGRTYDHPDEIVDAVLDRIDPRLLPGLRLGSFRSVFGASDAALMVILARKAEMSAASRLRVFETLRPQASDVKTNFAEPVVFGPRGLSVERREYVVPGALVDAMSMGMVEGLEDKAAEAMAELLRSVAERIKAEPHHLHVVVMNSAHARGKGFFEQITAFCGLSKEMRDLACLVEERRKKRIADIGVAIRKEMHKATVPAPEGGWSKQVALLPAVGKEAVARMRAEKFSNDFVI